MSRMVQAAIAAVSLLLSSAEAARGAETPPAMPVLEPKSLYAEALKRIQEDPKSREASRAQLAPPDAPMPHNAAHLDNLLKTKAYEELFAALTSANDYETVSLDLNWEQRKLFEGGGLLLVHAYVNDLWRVGQALKIQRGDDSLMQTAVAFSLYAEALIEVDGPRCADPAAPAYRRRQLSEQRPELWAFSASLPKAARDGIVAVSLGYEALTSAVRQPDEVLCQGPATGSMLEMVQGLAQLAKEGKAPKEVERPGVIGKSYEVPRAPPSFRSEAEWKPQQAAARQHLPDLLIETASKGPPRRN